ncbi:MAG: alpha/beta hydrolase [Bacteroidales bacterium]
MADKYLSVNGKRLHYTQNGQGDCIVFVHGFIESIYIWERFDKVLSEKFKVICIDLPGHGQSDRFGEEHSIEMQAKLIKLVLEQENISSLTLIGHSMGGYVCLSFALQYPECTKAVGLFHSHAGPDSSYTTEFRNKTIDLLNADKDGFITHFVPDLFAEGNAVHFPKQVEKLVTDGKAMDVNSIIASQIGMRDRGSFLSVYEQKIPFMFIQGKRDTKSNLQKVMAQAMMPLHSEILLVDSGHMGFFEQEQVCVSFVKGFVERVYL